MTLNPSDLLRNLAGTAGAVGAGAVRTAGAVATGAGLGAAGFADLLGKCSRGAAEQFAPGDD